MNKTGDEQSRDTGPLIKEKFKFHIVKNFKYKNFGLQIFLGTKTLLHIQSKYLLKI